MHYAWGALIMWVSVVYANKAKQSSKHKNFICCIYAEVFALILSSAVL